MHQWEYLAVPMVLGSGMGPKELREQLNKWGEGGWELVLMLTKESEIFVFKRPKLKSDPATEG
jgi:hypothetical protein